jgi:magnesium-transporting ATPase (P-type)
MVIINKTPYKRTGFFKLFFIAMNDMILKILIVAAVISIFILIVISIVISMIFADDNERPIAWVEGGAILLAVLVVTTVTAWNDY